MDRIGGSSGACNRTSIAGTSSVGEREIGAAQGQQIGSLKNVQFPATELGERVVSVLNNIEESEASLWGAREELRTVILTSKDMENVTKKLEKAQGKLKEAQAKGGKKLKKAQTKFDQKLKEVLERIEGKTKTKLKAVEDAKGKVSAAQQEIDKIVEEIAKNNFSEIDNVNTIESLSSVKESLTKLMREYKKDLAGENLSDEGKKVVMQKIKVISDAIKKIETKSLLKARAEKFGGYNKSTVSRMEIATLVEILSSEREEIFKRNPNDLRVGVYDEELKAIYEAFGKEKSTLGDDMKGFIKNSRSITSKIIDEMKSNGTVESPELNNLLLSFVTERKKAESDGQDQMVSVYDALFYDLNAREKVLKESLSKTTTFLQNNNLSAEMHFKENFIKFPKI